MPFQVRHLREKGGRAVALATLIISSISLPPGRAADTVVAPQVNNPHWQTSGCNDCHNGQQKIPRSDVDRLCLRCHDGKHAVAEVHPILRGLENTGVPPPPGWPLVDGRLGCITCHDVRTACNVKADTSPDDPNFLRGRVQVDPDNPQQRGFCQNCHSYSTQRFNPHLMLDSNGQVIPDRCLFCHEKLLDRQLTTRSNNPQLRFAQIVLCKSCHPFHKEILKGGHLNVKVKDDIAAYMRAREIVGLAADPSEQLLSQLKAEKARPTHMYVASDGGVMCATCHNPHQEGLFSVASPLHYRAMHVMDGHPVSPVHDQSFCRNCHRL